MRLGQEVCLERGSGSGGGIKRSSQLRCYEASVFMGCCI